MYTILMLGERGSGKTSLLNSLTNYLIKFQYSSNEILTAFLNTDMYDIIEEDEWISRIKRLKNKLILSSDMDYEDYMNYNNNVKSATKIVNENPEKNYGYKIHVKFDKRNQTNRHLHRH